MPDNELKMARAALPAGAVMAVVAAVVAGLLRGAPAALTALGGVGVVVAVFALTGWSLARAARIGLRTLRAVALGGFVLRLFAYGAAVVLLMPVEGIDRTVLGVTVGAAATALLVYESVHLLRHPEFWWVHPDVDGREAA